MKKVSNKRVKTKYLLYALKLKSDKKYSYCYETDNKYFIDKKPPKYILNSVNTEVGFLEEDKIIKNPWKEWNSNDIQKIVTQDGICINYLKSTDETIISRQEDFKLLEIYSYLVDNFDISKTIKFDTIKKWHKMVFETIYPFAGDLRNVNMSKEY